MNIILLNKKPGITSFDALRDIKKELKTTKVGHTGTLDKFAQGLLIILTGKALRLSKYFSHLDKQYIGKIRFGEETDTLDPEGEVIAQSPLPTREQVEKVLPLFTGEILQTPPVYSALHINGKRASELARSGKPPQMKERPVTIYKLDLLSWNPPFAEFFVHCSSGTYIRSLARDIALAAKARAHLTELKRIKVGEFELGSREQGAGNREHLNINKDIIRKLGIPILEINSEQIKHVRHGKPLESLSYVTSVSSGVNNLALFCHDELVAIIEKANGKYKYDSVFV